MAMTAKFEEVVTTGQSVYRASTLQLTLSSTNRTTSGGTGFVPISGITLNRSRMSACSWTLVEANRDCLPRRRRDRRCCTTKRGHSDSAAV